MKRRTCLSLMLAALLGACGQPQTGFKNTDLSAERIFPSAQLASAHGQPVDFKQFHGKLVIVFFGYTSCPDVCPSAMRKYASLLRNLRTKEAEQIQVLFISVDPARDTPEKADTYVKWFNPGFLGATGTDAQIADVARQFKAIYSKQPVAGGMGYVMDHSALAYVVDPQGQLRLAIPETAGIESIADDLRQLLSAK